MSEKISSLMDGELTEEELTIALREMSQDPSLKHTWDTYSLISDAMKGEMASTSVADRVSEQLKDEPIVFAPSAQKKTSFQSFQTFALAASVSVACVMGWQLYQKTESSADFLQAQVVGSKSLTPTAEDTQYLMAHHEVSAGQASWQLSKVHHVKGGN